MPANLRAPRQKACIRCAKSKRKCDRKLPECQRCLDRDEECSYPQRKRRRRDPPFPSYDDTDALENSLDFEVWDADLDISRIPTFPDASLLAQELGLDSDNISCPWFLQDETWILRQCEHEPACNTVIELESFVSAVNEMLRSWVTNGHNSFIHRRLYEQGMPLCLQDAFTTLAAYNGRTPAVKEIILRIAEERSAKLALESTPTAGGMQGILAHLARVQALFVYEFITLFDGSVRPRASAEKLLPTLRQWILMMLEVVKGYRGEDSSLSHRPLQWTTEQFDREYDTSSDMWQLWILIESVRRSHLVVDTIANIYETMTKGLVDCAGGVMFTARRGLWEAESAVKWFELCCEKSPLLVPSLQPGPLISQHSAEELDDFAKFYWRFIVGADKIQCWIDKSKTSRIY
jgi:Fungal Zn(2)-Cys(6) binuclear cluster domain